MGIAERKEREKEQRRVEIIDAAERIFFSKGLEVATMDDVAEEAELSKGTLYLYFKNKEDLYLAINERGLKILEEIFQTAIDKHKTGLDKIIAIGNAYRDFSLKYRNYFNVMIYYESHDYDFKEKDTCAYACHMQGQKTLTLVAKAIQMGIEDGSIRSDIHPFNTAVILWGQSTGMIQILLLKGEHLKKLHDIDTDEVMNLFTQMVVCSLKP
ncbi:MAG: TetR/AcrR family transcriptional regulator [Calditrichaceae bacterium]|nr:TetR/AcrR family transcriptional regulator [Calditrichaceae bacterium]MBN2708315.1 TetR/AcrR family transcriptional regulator [Calditrichaceae bacterium]RQV97230.1 MAG: TetR/AcrR family transcriptional regulator [Calditrichota bacterium]